MSDIWLRETQIPREEIPSNSNESTDRIAHTPAFVNKLWSTNWNEKQLNGSAMWDRSDDPRAGGKCTIGISVMRLFSHLN